MIGYVTLGTNDLTKAATFYDQVFAQMGAKRFMEMERFIAWQVSDAAAGVALTEPFDGQKATAGNGVMVALSVDAIEQVNAVYNKAIELGATCEGKPGFRPDLPGFYAGYFRDLDGNKLNAFCFCAPE
ncbi:MAG: VOC family protein [Gammaproteobacteria bacterium]|nr:VOC family protein [Gammaproteobacteria bacterium]